MNQKMIHQPFLIFLILGIKKHTVLGTDPLKWDSIKKAFLLGYRLPIFYR